MIVIEKSFEKTHILNLMALYFLGIFLFHTLLWEVQERYAYIVIIPMILIGTVGLSQIYNYILEKKSQKRYKCFDHYKLYSYCCGMGTIL
ncbi:hypothetical protein LX03_01090 [Limosilactobacillus mucosae]|uniref:Uncharacterized protein n=1 Tax=Limosilactobacillus mucosae TaxID=97478 RepID=A0A099YDH9_LIMMU|nr:hypothetical protein LX03_01090 [Limosilactobacillus mucosae]